MKRSGLLRFCSLAIACLMLVGLVASPVLAAGNDPVLVTDKGALTLDASAVEGENVLSGHNYNVYKVMDQYSLGKDNDGKDLFQYKLTDKFTSFSGTQFIIDTANGKITLAEDITIGNTTYDEGTVLTDTFSDQSYPTVGLAGYFARELSVWAQTNNIAPDAVMNDGQTATDLSYGYYLVLEDDSADPVDNLQLIIPTLVNVDGAKTVTLKSSKITLDKSVDGNSDPGQTKHAIGEVAEYVVVTLIPTYATNVDPSTVKYTLTDVMSEGLTMIEDSIHLFIADEDVTESCDIDVKVGSNKTTTTIDVPGSLVLVHAGAAVRAEYSAIVNEKAVYNSEEDATNNNIVTLEYSRNPGVTEDSNTLEDDTVLYSYAVDLKKLDGAHEVLLPGATFTLSKASGDDTSVMQLIKTAATDVDEYRPVKEGETGITSFTTTDKEIRFIGLCDGSYVLNETAAPSGYSKIATPMGFDIIAEVDQSTGKYTGGATVEVKSDIMSLENDDSTVAVGYVTADGASNVNIVIKNFEGITLPSTGSLTSILVMGGGAAVVLGGGIFLFARRKKDDDDED